MRLKILRRQSYAFWQFPNVIFWLAGWVAVIIQPGKDNGKGGTRLRHSDTRTSTGFQAREFPPGNPAFIHYGFLMGLKSSPRRNSCKRAADFGRKNGREIQKVLADFGRDYIFALLSREITVEATEQQAALVKGLRRIPFTDESRVRFPYAVQRPDFDPAFLCPYSACISVNHPVTTPSFCLQCLNWVFWNRNLGLHIKSIWIIPDLRKGNHVH